MNNQNMTEIHKKLDTLVNTTHNMNTDIRLIEQHLKQLNGKIIEHEKKFEKTFNEFNEIKKTGNNKFINIEKKIESNTKELVFAKGSLFALTILSLILGLIISLKTIGII